ncbi:MAG: septum formation protein Maf [Candidatus Omnitrophica bacterium]|nr:septum formation protein Maf [Candidatus Omnitrophota bacterium]
MKIVLASASKRRSKILESCGIPHRVAKSGVSEKMDRKKGAKFNVLHNARIKAEKIADRYKKSVIIGADTLVLLGKRIIGKPKTRKEAKLLLRAFSGKKMLVYTGLCVIDSKTGKSASAVDISRVCVRKLSRGEINKFVKIAGPHDKAGGFSIEGPGAFIFDNINGSFYNVLGLPMIKLGELFRKLGVDLLGTSNKRR